jgi:hypothetical protein
MAVQRLVLGQDFRYLCMNEVLGIESNFEFFCCALLIFNREALQELGTISLYGPKAENSATVCFK